ncbi:MAG: carbamoyltransferase HypF [Planctomycetota bacterium]
MGMRAERLRIEGIVQGVGFRPFVWHLAQEFGLLGRVWNHSQGVSIEIWGAQEVFDRFAAALRERAPAHARIDAIQRQDLAVPGPAPAEFVIAASEAGEVRTEPLADLASCPDCVREVLDPADRRFGYALSNCTHCGPRLSIVERLPYDRENTTMARFAMCADCACEYADPADRRFHAQPIACAKCGPQVRLVDGQGREISGEAIAGAGQRIRGGQIVAIKGLGGYHLCCDARQAEAVERLRERKHRPRKPLAVMARDLDVVRRFARLNEEESRLLCAPAAPIVLLHAAGEPLPETVAPGQHTLGFLLPYTPLHHLLLREFDGPLVMTSGNLSEEPQVTEDGEARARLGSIADAFLVHDRPIHNRVDDSVVQFAAGATRVLRRARGLAPQSLPLPPGFQGDQMGLAMGAELKASFCLARAGRLVLSQHMGDLSEPTALADYLRHLDLYLRLNDCGPQWIAVDGHPDAHSRLAGLGRASALDLPVHEVQHHHAHIAAVLGEHGWPLDAGPVLGIALDGTGWGEGGGLWGGEFLVADYRQATRVACLEASVLPGGTQAILQPWRITLAALQREGLLQRAQGTAFGAFLATQNVPALLGMLQSGLNCPETSSAGRWLDGVAAVLGIAQQPVQYEGQPAIELEALAASGEHDWRPGELAGRLEQGRLTFPGFWRALLDWLEAGVPRERIAWRAQRLLADGLVSAALGLAREAGVQTVALGGGVFHNRFLLGSLLEELQAAGLKVLAPEQVPAGDGGIAFGQALVALARSDARS